MHKNKSQVDKILAHLKRGKTITALQALSQYGIARLASRVNELRDWNHKLYYTYKGNIVTEKIAVKCRGGRVAIVGRYRLVK